MSEAEPAAEILSALERRISIRHFGVAFATIFFSDFKDPEDEASQLNRLGETELSPVSTTRRFRRRTVVRTDCQLRPVSDAY